MRIPQLRLESQMAQIAINTTPGKQYIKQPKAELSIEQPRADLSIQTKRAKLHIDQTKAWEERNLMSTRRHIEKFASDGLAAVSEGMERRAMQGTELMKIENKGNPIVDQAIINGHKQMKNIHMKFIPSPFSVKVDAEPAELHLHVISKQPIIQAITRKPIHEYERGSLQIYMEKYAQLHIDFVHNFSVYA